MSARATARLPLYLAVVYTLLALYGSLFPFSGWRTTGADPFAFLAAAWPRYYTDFDLVANAAAYLPLGFLWVAVLAARLPALAALALALLGCGLFSFGVEYGQNFLPGRVPSNLDFACNLAGACLGALAGLRWGTQLLDGGRLHAWRESHFLGGTDGDRGLVLLALWWLTQLNPETFLFGNGNLRALLGLPAALEFEAGQFFEMEMITVTAHTLAVGLIAGRLARNRPVLLPCAVIGAALLVKSFALLVLMQGSHGLGWLTPGAAAGLLLGMALWAGALKLGLAQRQALAALVLMLATALANLMPDNPYLKESLRVWQQGHFLNFNGLTRLVSSLWPFLALSWLMLARRTNERCPP
ncbi:MAG: VanZ family protein [Sulfuritalea sp.]|nr:VanZ family protein [Sulfuritalea sp.]